MENTTLQLQKAIDIARGGGIVIFPTDTAFGIGCRIDDPKAVDRLFKIRMRPRTQATPVLVASKAMAKAYFSAPSYIVRRLMDWYWPGALTIIAPCKKNLVYSPIRGAGKNIGLRMPNHEVTLAIIRGVGVPILGPSANFHGHGTPFQFTDLDPELVKQVDYVVSGECPLKEASTVVDASVLPIRIVRQGAVKLARLFIDTSKIEEISVTFEIGANRFEKKMQQIPAAGQMVLPLIQTLLKEHNIDLKNIFEINVHPGPGSFTGLRVGFAVANALGALSNIPVNGLSGGRVPTPTYT